MCLAVVAVMAHPQYRLVVAANRDEYHAREASAAAWWAQGILAGTDRVAGGSWFGVTREGRWSLITNFRESVMRDPEAPSRGSLVTRALLGASTPLECAAATALDGGRFHGFNLLVGDATGAAYGSNRASGAIALGKGIHGLSNHLLDTPWPKLRRAEAALSTWLADGGNDRDELFVMLRDEEKAVERDLPSTGLSPERERLLSSVFIVSPDYGTRCSTILTIDAQGSARFTERTFDPAGAVTNEVDDVFATLTDRAATNRLGGVA